jgi:hypothetical protein
MSTDIAGLANWPAKALFCFPRYYCDTDYPPDRAELFVIEEDNNSSLR